MRVAPELASGIALVVGLLLQAWPQLPKDHSGHTPARVCIQSQCVLIALQDPGCYCPGMLQAGFNWLIKNTDLNAKRRTCKDYCAKHACPGRAGRRNCNASKASVCTTAFA